LKKILHLSILALFSSLPIFGQTLSNVAIIQNIDVVHLSSDFWGSGMSFYDFDNDGWDDLTIPLENDSIAFFKNNGGTYTQIGSFLYSIGELRQLLWVDYDNNGTMDICVTYDDLGIRLYKNDGQYNFSDVTSIVGIDNDPAKTWGISFADPDGDGDLDLYVAYYQGQTGTLNTNKYYQNQGNGTFEEKGALLGVDDGLKLSFIGVWFDYDNDDRIDLHVINDKFAYGDALYRNLGDGTFADVAVAEGIQNMGHDPMSCSVSDYNNDGNQDVFVTDVNNGQLLYGVPANNKLFKNQSGGNFIDVAPAMNLDSNIFAWGALWVDYNNDGFEDLYIATAEFGVIINPQPSLFYRNNGGQSFTLINDSILSNVAAASVCPVKGDINNDGFYDVAVLNNSSFSHVLANSGNSNNYIKITPVLNQSNRQAIGAKVKVYADGMAQYQTVFCGSGMCAQNSQHMIFGVNAAPIVDSVVITYPDGAVSKKYNLAVNQSYTIHPPFTQYVNLANGEDTLIVCHDDTLFLGQSGYSQYLWNTGSNADILTVTQAGNYSFSALGQGDTLIQSNELTVLFEDALLYQEFVQQPICGGPTDGTVELVFANPADSLHTIVWSNGDSGVLADSLQTGMYNYTITTLNSCQYSGAISILDPPIIEVVFITTPATDFHGGSVVFYPFGGEAPFIYTMDSAVVASQISNLAPGTYQVVVEDANGCSVVVQFTINDESSAALDAHQPAPYQVFYTDNALFICSEMNKEIQQVQLIDMMGSNVKMGSDWTNAGATCIRTSVNVPSGIYRVMITTTREGFSASLVIE